MKAIYVKNRMAVVYMGQRVREFRQAAGLSQVELSRRVFNWPKNTKVSNIERGQRQVSAVELWRIARTLNRSWDEFFPSRSPHPAGRVSLNVRQCARRDRMDVC